MPKAKAQQQVQEIENRTQLGIQRNQQQVQRLENGYGVNELRQRNTMNRPPQRNVRKTKSISCSTLHHLGILKFIRKANKLLIEWLRHSVL